MASLFLFLLLLWLMSEREEIRPDDIADDGEWNVHDDRF